MANKEEKKEPIKKTEEKSVLYHKDGIIFVDVYKAIDQTDFEKIDLPKGITMTCVNCSSSIYSYSYKYKAYYCAHCLRLYPERPYDLEKPSSKKKLQEWTELIRPIVPSTKNKPKKGEPKQLSPEEIKEMQKKAEEFKEFEGLF